MLSVLSAIQNNTAPVWKTVMLCFTGWILQGQKRINCCTITNNNKKTFFQNWIVFPSLDNRNTILNTTTGEQLSWRTLIPQSSAHSSCLNQGRFKSCPPTPNTHAHLALFWTMHMWYEDTRGKRVWAKTVLGSSIATRTLVMQDNNTFRPKTVLP